MKIGIDIRNIGKKRTGDEVVFFYLVKNLAQIDTQNEYLLFTDITDTTVLRNMVVLPLGIENKSNFKIISLKTSNRFTWNFWTLSKYLCDNPVDVYLTQYIIPLFIPEKIKIATIVHDVSFKVYRQFIKKSDLFFLDILIPMSFKRANKIIGVSKFTRDEIIKHYKIAPEKVAWIHNAVGDNFNKEISTEESDAIRKKYNLPEKFILYIGTLQPRKNLPTLIEAYAGLSDEIKSEIKLVIAGGKGHNYDKKIDETVKKYSLKENVIFPGFINENDKPAIFKLSHVFCNPSFYEGFGITVLEAMASGIPVIASNIPPHREAAENSIIYHTPEKSAELTEKLNSVLINQDLREELRQKEIAQAKEFSWKASAEKLLGILTK